MRAEIDLKVGSKKNIEQQLPNHVIVKVFAHWLNIKLEVWDQNSQDIQSH